MSSPTESSPSTGQTSPDTQMCARCQAAPWKPLTLSAAGSPANLFREQVNGKRKPMRGGCGQSSPVWWVTYDPDTSSWRTCQGYGQPLMQVPRLSLTLPRSAMTVDGTVYLLPPLEHPTSERESSYWPTPVANDDNKSPEAHMRMKTNMPGGPRHKITSLQVMVKAMEQGKYSEMWPTPTARDHKDTGTNVDWQKVADKVKLPGAVMIEEQKRWPTPTARLGSPRGAQAKRVDDPARSNDLDDAVLATSDGDKTQPKALNPSWVAWLMGFPPSWTDISE